MQLTVSDGTATATQTATVTTTLAEPLAAAAGDDRIVEAGKPLTFDGRGSRPAVGIESYHWQFGDGTQADGAVVTHTFATAGAQTAKLTVGAGSATSSDSAAVTVLAPARSSPRTSPPRATRSAVPTCS